MSVLNGYRAVVKEEINGIMYDGDFYSPLDLALEAYESFGKSDFGTAMNILGILEECMSQDYQQGWSKIMVNILYHGMASIYEQKCQENMNKLRTTISSMSN